MRKNRLNWTMRAALAVAGMGIVGCAPKSASPVASVSDSMTVVNLATTKPLFMATPAAPGQATYESPEAAAKALMTAVRSGDRSRIIAVLGPAPADLVPEGKELLRTDLDAFSHSARSSLRIERGVRSAHVFVGKEQWPFPVPLAQGADGRWYFDIGTGTMRMAARRIGANELRTIEVMQALVQAEREYYEAPHDGEVDLHQYALRIPSAAGKHDGLFWEGAAGDGVPASPVGPRVAAATVDAEHPIDKAVPYHGYLFRVLTAQGESAPGGAFSYLVNGHALLGFGIAAFPAKYGVTGYTTFITSNNGRVYQANLGPETEKEALGLTEYDPDPSWVLVAK
jgi:hypothetical protein